MLPLRCVQLTVITWYLVLFLLAHEVPYLETVLVRTVPTLMNRPDLLLKLEDRAAFELCTVRPTFLRAVG